MPVLKVQELNVFYGNIHALHDITFEVNEGEIVTLIGANGAGKTTTLHSISGLIQPRSGNIEFLGKTLTGIPANRIVEMGLAQVPEGRRIFASLTVMENLEMGAYTRKDRANIKSDLEMVFSRFPRLKERLKQVAGTLSGGEQQMLAMGRTLMSRPRMILMDEPSMGLAPLFVKEIFAIIEEINKQGTTILLVEQNAHMALSIAHKAYVLETGKIVLEGPADELAQNEQVKKAYLGG
ncbi:MAG TPA: ABC transporter ATP-binding protein [Bacillota bacterium]|nr:ABC transporter ATP-binding protein [Bacillota bacterium]